MKETTAVLFVVLCVVVVVSGGHHHHHTHNHYNTTNNNNNNNNNNNHGPLVIENLDSGHMLRGIGAGGVGTRPAGPAVPLRPFIDVIKKLLMAIVAFVWSIVAPFLMPLLGKVFQYVGPLVMFSIGFPLLATIGPLVLNLAQRVPIINKLLQVMVIPLFYLWIGIPQTPAFGLPYASFHGPPYGQYYGQAVGSENLKCFSMLEEYIKRCTMPASTLPLSFLELGSFSSGISSSFDPEESQESCPLSWVDAGLAPSDGVSSFLEMKQDDPRSSVYEGLSDESHPHTLVGYAGPDPYDPYGPDGPEGDPSPNVGFKRCRELLDAWLNTCGTPTQ